MDDYKETQNKYNIYPIRECKSTTDILPKIHKQRNITIPPKMLQTLQDKNMREINNINTDRYVTLLS